MGLFNRERFKVKEDLVYVKVGESGFETYEKSYYPQFSIKVGPWKYKWVCFKEKNGSKMKFSNKEDAWSYIQLNYLSQ